MTTKALDHLDVSERKTSPALATGRGASKRDARVAALDGHGRILHEIAEGLLPVDGFCVVRASDISARLWSDPEETDAGDNGINARAHMLMTCRRLDHGSPAGFAKSRNDTLAAIFESGGRRGDTRGDARERAASRGAAEWVFYDDRLGAWLAADEVGAATSGHPWRRTRQPSKPWCAVLGRDLSVASDDILQAMFAMIK